MTASAEQAAEKPASRSILIVSRASAIFARLRLSYREARQTISGQIKLTAGLVAAIFVILGAILSAVFLQVSARSEANTVLAMGALASADLSASIAESRYHAMRYASTGNEAEIVKATRRLDLAKSRLDETIETSRTSNLGELQDVTWLRAQVEGFELEIKALTRAMKAEKMIAVGALANAIDLSGQLLMDYARDYEAQFVARAEESSAKFAAFKTTIWTAALVIVLIAMAGAFSLARFFVRNFADAIAEMTHAMAAIADGSENTAIPSAKREDEIGAMARSLAIFRTKANEVIQLQSDVAEASKRELEQREELQMQKHAALGRFADQFEMELSDVVGHVASASQQLNDTANEMAAAATMASELSREVALSVGETSQGVTLAATATDQFARSIEEVGRQAVRSAMAAQDASQNAKSADAEIEVLFDTTNEASQLIELISSIAERTNLLALNASIEAARGGEAGRGFAVVAMEVKELARQTQTATEAVSAQITAIQNSTQLSVSALKQVAEQIGQMETNSAVIAQAVEEQTLASRELASSIEQAARGSGSLSQQFERVTDLAEVNGETARQLVKAAGGLQSQSHALDNQARQFATKVRAG